MDNRQVSQLTTGAIIILVGLLLLAGQLDAGWHFGRLWPLILVAIGAGQFLSTERDGRRGNGLWMLFLGGIFLMHTFRVLTFHYSWPLFIVFVGFMILFKRERDGRPRQGDNGRLQS